MWFRNICKCNPVRNIFYSVFDHRVKYMAEWWAQAYNPSNMTFSCWVYTFDLLYSFFDQFHMARWRRWLLCFTKLILTLSQYYTKTEIDFKASIQSWLPHSPVRELLHQQTASRVLLANVSWSELLGIVQAVYTNQQTLSVHQSD